jgi:hypothetical protein
MFPFMRATLLVALVIAFLPVIAVADTTETSIPVLMGQAQRAYVAGDFDTAKSLFNQVLEVQPTNTVAIQFLRAIRQRQAGLPTATTKDPLKELILPKIDFREATFSTALDFFKQKAAEQGVTVSFVSQLPAAQMEHTVTLNLSNIPFLDALRYLCQLNNATFNVERFAIVIMPVPAAANSPAPAAQ